MTVEQGYLIENTITGGSNGCMGADRGWEAYNEAAAEAYIKNQKNAEELLAVAITGTVKWLKDKNGHAYKNE